MEEIVEIKNTSTDFKILLEAINNLGKLVAITQRWLTMQEACSYSKMSKNTLMECIATGNIKACKKRGKWIVDRLSVDEYYGDGEIEVIVKDLMAKRKNI
jgi:excisionase family DNA binding protein